MTGKGTAAVVGGGLAGVAAAIRLADNGYRVVLVEARPRLGGATYSFDRSGLPVDTGQHVFLRCYDAYRALLHRLGVDTRAPVQDRLDIPVLFESEPPARLRRARGLPAPLHLLPALIGYRALTPAERTSALRAAAALRRVDPADPLVDDETFGDWLTRHGQSSRTVRRLWGLVTVAALNLPPGEASLALAAKVFRTGLLAAADAGDVGVPAVPLLALHGDPAGALLGRLGVRLLVGERVTAVEATDAGVLVRTQGGEVPADAAVVAVPHQQAAKLLSPQVAGDVGAWAELGASPILNVHVHYDRPVTALPFAAAPESPVQWIFDKTTAAGVDAGQYLVTSVSAADQEIGRRSSDLRDAHLAALAALLPSVATARVLDAFVTREPRATFRQRAGTARLRPGPATASPRILLAGAWTATGWPDTMEGAVRSGNTAADMLMSRTLESTLLTETPA